MLINQTTGEPLACQVIRCDTFGRRLRGLMFRRPLKSDEAYLFVFHTESIVSASVHSLFVFPLFPWSGWMCSGGWSTCGWQSPFGSTMRLDRRRGIWLKGRLICWIVFG